MKKYFIALSLVLAVVIVTPQVTHAGVLEDLLAQVVKLQQMLIQLIARQPKPTTTPTQTSPTTDWKTYQSEQYGYSFSYPNNYSLSINQDVFSHNYEKFPDFPREEVTLKILDPEGESIEISVWDKGDVLWVSDRCIYGSDETIGQQKVVAQVRSCGDVVAEKTYSVTLGDKIVRINFIHNFSIGGSRRLPDSVVKSILSSFRFPTPTSASWKTYTNNEYGFSLKYPGDSAIDSKKIDGGSQFTFRLKDGQRKLEINIVGGGNPRADACQTYKAIGSKVINGVSFTKQDVSNYYIGMNSLGGAIDYCVMKDNYTYHVIPILQVVNSGKNQASLSSDAILNQMVESFKFTTPY